MMRAVCVALVLILTVSATHAQTYRLALNATLTLTSTFWERFAGSSLSTPISKDVASIQFPDSTNHPTRPCEKITINAGSWISSVTFPANGKKSTTASVTGPSSLTFKTAGVTVKNSDKDSSVLTWQGQKSSSVANPLVPNGMYTTCFQVCYGFAPYTASAPFLTNLSFQLAPGKRLSVDSASGQFDTSASWSLPKLRGRCMEPHETFESVFNSGLKAPLAQNSAQFGSTIAAQLEPILGNSTPNGFCSLTSAEGGKSAMLAQCQSVPSAMPSFDSIVAGASSRSKSSFASTGSAIKAVVALPHASLPTEAVPSTSSCFFNSGQCGAVVSTAPPPSNSFYFRNCAACISFSTNGAPFLGFSTDIVIKPTTQYNSFFATKHSRGFAAASNKGSSKMRLTKKVVQFDIRPTVPSEHLPNVKPSMSQSGPAPSTTTFISLPLVESVAMLGAAESRSILANLSSAGTPPNGSPLHGAEDYCTLHHDTYQWTGLAEKLTLQVNHAESATSSNGGVRVHVSIPELQSLAKTVNFRSRCAVQVPLGTPFEEETEGWLSLSMAALPSSNTSTSAQPFNVSFTFTPSGLVTDVVFSTLRFTATKTYRGSTSAFDAFLQHKLVTLVAKQSFFAQTVGFIQGSVTSAWLNKVRAMASRMSALQRVSMAPAGSSVPTSSSMTIAFSTAASATNGTVQALPTLDAVVPANATAPSNLGELQVLEPIENFTTSCHFRQPCSPAVPLNTTGSGQWYLQFTNCTTCLREIKGTLYYGTRTNVALFQNPTTTVQNRHGDPHPDSRVEDLLRRMLKLLS